jgi:hypothetical protein
MIQMSCLYRESDLRSYLLGRCAVDGPSHHQVNQLAAGTGNAQPLPCPESFESSSLTFGFHTARSVQPYYLLRLFQAPILTFYSLTGTRLFFLSSALPIKLPKSCKPFLHFILPLLWRPSKGIIAIKISAKQANKRMQSSLQPMASPASLDLDLVVLYIFTYIPSQVLVWIGMVYDNFLVSINSILILIFCLDNRLQSKGYMLPCTKHALKNDSQLKLDNFYFANGVYSDIWRGSFEGNAVAVKVWRGASLPFPSRVKFVMVCKNVLGSPLSRLTVLFNILIAAGS